MHQRGPEEQGELSHTEAGVAGVADVQIASASAGVQQPGET